MSCCGCKQYLKILAGIVFILVGIGVLGLNPWLVLGAYFLLRGCVPMMCKCDSCCDMKKKK